VIRTESLKPEHCFERYLYFTMKYQHIQPHCRRTLARTLVTANVVLFAFVLLGFDGRATAQTAAPTAATTISTTSSSTTNQTPAEPQASPITPPAAGASGDSTKAYTDSLKTLSSLYEQEAKKLAQENDKLKQLYADGLISRVEMEHSDKSLADARARIETTQKQIAEANLKPAPTNSADSGAGFTNASWTTGNNNIDNLIRYYGGKSGLDPFLIFCLMNQESGFASRVTSPKGARGLMQLMPATAARYGVTNPFDPAQSISAGTRYLKDLLQMFNGRLDLALAGYNAGEGAVIKYGYQIPPYSETQNYVRLITMRYVNKGGVSKRT
jgi:soluble lytic murein transglycosylase-like protein